MQPLTYYIPQHPPFTEVGFQVVQTPPHIHAKLKAAVDAGVANWDSLPYEHGVGDSIYAYDTPKFVHIHDLAWEVIRELRPLHEAWAGGIQLRPTSACIKTAPPSSCTTTKHKHM